jgi:tripartite-type tricarboxylate transporter receptor subunit TctC
MVQEENFRLQIKPSYWRDRSNALANFWEDAMFVKPAILSALAVSIFGIVAAVSASAQVYPTRPVTIVIPFPPGSNTDGVGRLLAQKLSVSLGRPVIVENRPGGAGGTVGAKLVADAVPDGHTLLYSSPGPLVVAPAIYKDVGYDPVKNFIPIATTFSIAQMLVVNRAVPVRSIGELVAYAKAKPGKINYASPGYGTQPHLLGEMFKLAAGIEIVHVPYKGPAPAITDLLAGQVQMYFDTVGILLPHIQAGKLRALAVAEESRDPQLPDVPTTVESGFPKLQATYWSGLLAPAGTSAAIVKRLNNDINDAMKSKEIEAMLASLSAKPKLGSPDAFAAFMAAETQKWAATVKAGGITAE